MSIIAPKTSMKIEGKEYAVKDAFNDNFLFIVPVYQRSYAWEVEQAGELLDDFIECLQKNRGIDVDNLSPYFLGSIVLIKGDKPDAQLVDGQQRITTLTILLAALQATLGEQKGKDIQKFLYEEGNALTGVPDRYRLKLRDKDEAFFREFVQENGGIKKLRALTQPLSQSQRNIRDNALLFLDRLDDELDEKDQLRLAQFIVCRCFLVAVTTPDLDTAYRTFKVLNDRGMDLSITDILKAELIGNLTSGLQSQYNQKWEDAEQLLERAAFEELFSHIRMIQRKTKPEIAMLAEFRQNILPKYTPEEFIDKKVIPYSETFDDILHAQFESSTRSDEINGLLRFLNRIEHKDWIPPAILFLSENRADPEKILRFLSDLERLTAILSAIGERGRKRINRYGRILGAIEKKEDLYSDGSPLQLTQQECTAMIGFLNGDLYEKGAVAQYILLRLDSILSDGSAVYQYKQVSIEHVLPQTPPPHGEWAKWFPDQGTNEEWLHKLANLVLLTRRKNSRAQNYEFERKTKEYFFKNGVSPFVLTNEVRSEREWTPQVLTIRQKRLVGELAKAWRLNI